MRRIFFIIFLSALFSVNGSAQPDAQKRLEIDDFIARADKTFETSNRIFTVTERRQNKAFTIEEYNFKIQKGELLNRKYSYSLNGNDVERLAVYYKTGKFSAEETYYFQNRQLVYATEQHFLESGGETDPVWSAHFYFSDRKIIAESSNGHGKSEDDQWDSEKEVLKMSRTRLSQLNKYLARQKAK